jgi:hypothetical protein
VEWQTGSWVEEEMERANSIVNLRCVSLNFECDFGIGEVLTLPYGQVEVLNLMMMPYFLSEL